MPRFRFQIFWKTELNTASILLVLNSSKDLEHGTSISLLHVRGCRPSVWVCLTYQSLVNLARVCRWLPCQNMKRNAMQTPIVRSWLIYMCSVQTNLSRSARQKHGQLKLLRLCLGPNELFDRATLNMGTMHEEANKWSDRDARMKTAHSPFWEPNQATATRVSKGEPLLIRTHA